MRTTVAGLAVLLVACSGSGAPERASDEAAARATPAPPTPPTPRKPDPAIAIHASEETERINYELTIPVEAAALSALKARLTKDARDAQTSTAAQQADYARNFPNAGNKTFGVQHNWRTVGQTERLLSPALDVSGYTGGAHGSAGTVPLLWDRQTDREVPLAGSVGGKFSRILLIADPYVAGSWAEGE